MGASEVSEHHLSVRRTARYFTLGGLSHAPRDLWIVLHGYGQLASTFIRYFADLDDGRTVVAAPETLNRYYTVPVSAAPAAERPVGATWMTREDRESEITDYVAYLDDLHAALRQQWTPAPPLTVVGFSQGAATASRWCALGAARASRWILSGGLPPPDLDLGQLARGLNDRPLTIVLGDADKYVSRDAVRAERARLESAGVLVELQSFAGGHAINREVLRRFQRTD